jgi:hypothetical protein
MGAESSSGADFRQQRVVPQMIVTPLTLLGGAFYSINT